MVLFIIELEFVSYKLVGLPRVRYKGDTPVLNSLAEFIFTNFLALMDEALHCANTFTSKNSPSKILILMVSAYWPDFTILRVILTVWLE